ncbi:MAG TPA: GGDEF domain-containing protein [Porticoccus sp.]|nr:GGDEF domain-containing protein [Porticoccus sp.]
MPDKQADATPLKTRLFFSLKWRTLLVISLLLVFINGLLNLLTYANLENQFEKQLSRSVEQNSSSLLAQSHRRLVELGGSMILAGQSFSGGKLSEQGIYQYFDKSWELFQIDWGIESASIYRDEIRERQWGITEDIAPLQQLIKQVNTSQVPDTAIYCNKECRLYAAIPLFFVDGSARILLLSTTLADFIIDFSRHSNLGVALLRDVDMISRVTNVTPFGYTIAAVTNKSVNLPLIVQLAAAASVDKFLEEGLSLQTSPGVYHYFYAISLASDNADSKNILMLIVNISKQHDDIFSNLIETLSISAAGLFASLLALLLVLWGPMARINRLAALLPLLAKSGFKEVRNELSGHSSGRFFIDELDVLDDTTESLSYQLEKFETEINHRTNELEKMALYDVLTGLANRRMFTDQLTSLINEFKQFNESFALVFIDLDNFKRINDTLGHDAGDDLLVEVSRRLKKSVRDTDIVSRLGGDEFTLLLPQISHANNAIDVINKVLEAFEPPVKLAGVDTRVTPSIGIAMAPDNGLTTQELMRCADIAMYQAKQQGKNTFCFYSKEMSD